MTTRTAFGVWVCRALCVAVAACAPVLVGGCGSDPRPATSQEPVADIRGAENGFELARWLVASTDEEMSGLLAEYESRPLPAGPASVQSWRTNGFRIIAVPTRDLDGIRQRFHRVGSLQRQWFGQTPLWVEGVRGPEISTPWRVALDNGRVDLPRGHLRLLTRCWLVPVLSERSETAGTPVADEVASELCIEMLPQHRDYKEVSGVDAMFPSRRTVRGPLDEGLVFDRLMMTMRMRSGDSYLIIPVRDAAGADDSGPIGSGSRSLDPDGPPGVGRVSRDDTGIASSAAPGTSAAPFSAGVFAAAASARDPILGEAMLMGRRTEWIRPGGQPADDEDSGAPQPRESIVRVVLVITPKVSSTYRLLP